MKYFNARLGFAKMTPVQAASIPLFLQRKGDSMIWQLIIDYCTAEMIFGKVRTGACVAEISELKIVQNPLLLYKKFEVTKIKEGFD
jgi:hypothetical protein